MRRYAGMKRLRFPALLAAGLATTSCYSGVGALHDTHVDVAKGEWAWCMTPDGRTTAWATTGRDAMGRTYGTCAPPNRFVRVYACGAGQVPPDETPETWAARVRMSSDNSLVGDSVGGRPFCAPHPPS